MEQAMTGERPTATRRELAPRGNKIRLFLSWAAVLLPLGWGVYQALQGVAAIFD